MDIHENNLNNSEGTGAGYVLTSSGPRKVKYHIVEGSAIYEGDILLGSVEEVEAITQVVEHNAKRILEGQPAYEVSGYYVEGSGRRWANKQIPYCITEGMNTDLIKRAIKIWEDHTSIRFPEGDFICKGGGIPFLPYVNFEPASICSSPHGSTGRRQTIKLSLDCDLRSVVHELGHTIGLYHEHTRPDRDKYITIHWDNIKDDQKDEFEIVPDRPGVVFGKYSALSIMHYTNYAFSKNGKPTITWNDNPSVDIGGASFPSPSDVATVEAMYAS